MTPARGQEHIDKDCLTGKPALLTVQEVADELSVHYMTAYKYIRQGRLSAFRKNSRWLIDPIEVKNFKSAQAIRTPGSTAPHQKTNVDWSQRLETNLIYGEPNIAWDTVLDAMNSGKSVGQVYLQMIVPAMKSIGDRWHQGEISVGDEHRASVSVGSIIGRLSPTCMMPGRKRGLVLIAGIPGDAHGIPIAIGADLLRLAGYSVINLGCDLPVGSLIDAIQREPEISAVVMSVTLRRSDESVRLVIEQISNALTVLNLDVPIVIGGASIDDHEHASRLGADNCLPKSAAICAAMEGGKGL